MVTASWRELGEQARFPETHNVIEGLKKYDVPLHGEAEMEFREGYWGPGHNVHIRGTPASFYATFETSRNPYYQDHISPKH
jgi:hypothetical protein